MCNLIVAIIDTDGPEDFGHGRTRMDTDSWLLFSVLVFVSLRQSVCTMCSCSSCGSQGVGDAVLVGFGEVRVHGKAHDPTGDVPCHRRAVGTAEVGIGRLRVERDRVMHGCRDAGVGELGLQCLAVLDQDAVMRFPRNLVFQG